MSVLALGVSVAVNFVFKFKSIEFIHLEFRLQPEHFVSLSVLARRAAEAWYSAQQCE